MTHNKIDQAKAVVDKMLGISEDRSYMLEHEDWHAIKDLRAYVNELEQALEQMQWQPIETAPKDGTKILAINGNGEGYNSYGDACLLNEIVIVYYDLKDGEEYAWRVPHCCDGVSWITPTHWMPLPFPPKEG